MTSPPAKPDGAVLDAPGDLVQRAEIGMAEVEVAVTPFAPDRPLKKEVAHVMVDEAAGKTPFQSFQYRGDVHRARRFPE